MEATVLKPQVMAEISCNNARNALLEVKKLQELVRKLEKQNEQLRTRAIAVNGCGDSCAGPASIPILSGSCCIPSPVPKLLRPSAPEEPYAYLHPQCTEDAETEDLCNGLSEPTVLDEVEILDLDSIFAGDADSEDTWLYVSPKAKPWIASSLSPLQWCRQVLDSLRPDVEAARRSVSNTLNQAHRWRGLSSSLTLPSSPVVGVLHPSVSAQPRAKPAVTEPTASFCTSSHPLPAVTQTPNGKGCIGLTERSPSFFSTSSGRSHGCRRPPLSQRSSFDSELNTSELEDDSISMGYKLQDLTDVQIMARMQEESLRQDYASTSASAGHRSSSIPFQSGQQAASNDRGLEDKQEHEPLPHPQLRQSDALQSHTFSKMAECRGSPSARQYLGSPYQLQYSQYSSPVMPSYTANTSQGPRTDKLRRSMPNLVRAPSIPCVPSVLSISSSASSASTIRNSQSFDSYSGLARQRSSISSPGQLQQRVHSMGNFPASPRQSLKAMAYVIPTMQAASVMSSAPSCNVPHLSKSGAPSTGGRNVHPRPTSVIGASAVMQSKTAQPVRSFLNAPKSQSTLSALRNGSWRDGRY